MAAPQQPSLSVADAAQAPQQPIEKSKNEDDDRLSMSSEEAEETIKKSQTVPPQLLYVQPPTPDAC